MDIQELKELTISLENAIETLRQLRGFDGRTYLDEYCVDDKYTEIPIQIEINGTNDTVAILWKCRKESANLTTYDLNSEHGLPHLIRDLCTFQDDLV